MVSWLPLNHTPKARNITNFRGKMYHGYHSALWSPSACYWLIWPFSKFGSSNADLLSWVEQEQTIGATLSHNLPCNLYLHFALDCDDRPLPPIGIIDDIFILVPRPYQHHQGVSTTILIIKLIEYPPIGISGCESDKELFHLRYPNIVRKRMFVINIIGI